MTDAELVRAAAEKVMGWKWQGDAEQIINPLKENEFRIVPGGGLFCHKVGWWNPLTSDADCWMLVDKLIHNGWKFELTKSTSEWYASFFQMDFQVRKPAFRCDNRNRRRSIVIAALWAVGVDILPKGEKE